MKTDLGASLLSFLLQVLSFSLQMVYFWTNGTHQYTVINSQTGYINNLTRKYPWCRTYLRNILSVNSGSKWFSEHKWVGWVYPGLQCSTGTSCRHHTAAQNIATDLASPVNNTTITCNMFHVCQQSLSHSSIYGIKIQQSTYVQSHGTNGHLATSTIHHPYLYN